MSVIVTGGAGFIGSHVVEALVARGDEVHVIDAYTETAEGVHHSGDQAGSGALPGYFRHAGDAIGQKEAVSAQWSNRRNPRAIEAGGSLASLGNRISSFRNQGGSSSEVGAYKYVTGGESGVAGFEVTIGN